MCRANFWNTKKTLLILAVFGFFIQMQAQRNEQISIESISNEEFTVSSLNGIPFTIVLEESNNDGQFHLGVNRTLTFKVADLIEKRSTLRIIFEDEIYHSLENNLIAQYHSDLDWIESSLDIPKSVFEKLPTRPVFLNNSLEELKAKVFEYANTESQERYFNQWIEKINYSVGAVEYFQKLFTASNGESNEHRHNFLPINIYEELQRSK
ncbi:hypothetical protein [Aquimarina sediminis]|uniref:hypothetical protein n=1 Tax=Aquimarina sediminis TaxID=2070536 RepID=UPI000CA00EC3|nr:hypothetical protein [Aquimarina sediminis]